MTLRQKKLAKNLGNSKTVKEAMIKSGYAESTARQQKSIIERLTFGELLEQELPDDKIMEVHKEGLEATRIYGTNDNFIEIPDYPTRIKAVELAYKVKKKLKESTELTGRMVIEIVRKQSEL